MHEKARAGRLVFLLALLLAVFGWLTPALPGPIGGGAAQQLMVLAEEPAAVPGSDSECPQARRAPTSSPALTASSSDGCWAVHASYPTADSLASLWLDNLPENSGTPVAAATASRSRAPPSV